MKIIDKIKCDIHKFSFAELTSNNSGKTSGSGTMGILISTCGSIAFLFGTFTKSTEVLTQSVIVIGIGAGLLGYRKSQEKHEDSTVDVPDEPANV